MAQRELTAHETNIEFNTYESFLNLISDQAATELRGVINDQQVVFISSLTKILNTNNTVSKKTKDIGLLEIKFYKRFYDVIKDYLYTITLFSLKEASKELKMKNPKKLSPSIKSWINVTSYEVTNKNLEETDQNATLPVIDNIDREYTNDELINKSNVAFENTKEKVPEQIIFSLEGKAIFRGRDLALKVYNKDIRLQAEGFLAATPSEIIAREKVVAAQWSAILDQHVCELCGSLDGKIIDINDPDYSLYIPGEMHLKCRCMWAYIKGTERPDNRKIDWVKPSDTLMTKFGKKGTGTNGVNSAIKHNEDFDLDKEFTTKEADDYIKTLENRGSESFVFENSTVRNKMVESVKNPRFRKYIGSSIGKMEFKNMPPGVRQSTLGRSITHRQKIELRSTVTNHIMYHELGHEIIDEQWQKKIFTWDAKLGRRVVEKDLLKSYHSAIGRFAEEVNDIYKTGTANIISYGNLTNNGYRPGKQSSERFIGLLKSVGGGRSVVSKYSLVNVDEYLAEGIGFFIDNPNKLKLRDPSLYNIIEKLFGGV